MFILRPVREKFSDLNRSAVRKRLPTPALLASWALDRDYKRSSSDLGNFESVQEGRKEIT